MLKYKSWDIDNMINRAYPHTIKKFDLIEAYVKAWAHKLLQLSYCSGIVFIDCMSNCGEYISDNEEQIFGTPVRVARYLNEISDKYQSKTIEMYFNDNSSDKINHLKSILPLEKSNCHYYLSTEDGNKLIKQIGNEIPQYSNKHYLLIYDPFEAIIDWTAIFPFLNNWCEVIINHMVSDTIRGISVAKSSEAVNKYQSTYLDEIENLIPFGTDKKSYNNRINDIMQLLHDDKKREYYISAFPFFNRRNSIVYNLIHGTSNINGFKLFKSSAWKVFEGKSSLKNTHGLENQIQLDLDNNGRFRTYTDEDCYHIKDIVEYVQDTFNGIIEVPLYEIWALLDNHPIFPSDGFKNIIKAKLNSIFDAKINSHSITFKQR